MLIFGECGPDVTEEELIDWFDNEHAHQRLAIKGVVNALRCKAIDDTKPTYLVTYDLSAPEVYLSSEFQSLRSNMSPRGKDILSRIATLNPGLYTQLSVRTVESALPTKYVLTVSLEPSPESEADFNKWYDEEHIPLLAKVSGFVRARRYKRVDAEIPKKVTESDPAPFPYVTVYEWTRSDFAQLPEVQATAQTPWCLEVMKGFLRKDYRTFELSKQIGKTE